ncbi:MAG: hypothetical protein EXS36_10550 [Pedosphaera sp.]|nr:hypothetical protein [Pedosphaera sp.]
MPTGIITGATLAATAVSDTDESTFATFNIPATYLATGTNLMAVEVHQFAGDSSDVSFDLGLVADTFANASVIDSISYSTQLPDVSLGRDSTNPNSWSQQALPSPGAANHGPVVRSLRETSGAVSASLEPGFYSKPQQLTLSAGAGDIRYTLDGTVPTAASSIYSGSFKIASNTVVKSRVFESGKVPGPVDTRTVFIGEALSTVPIVSFAADPETLFGDRIGIYYNRHEPVSENAKLRDVYKDKEIPSTVEFFEPDGTRGFEVNAGTTIGSENSWVVAQRPLNIHLRSALGNDLIHYDLFPGSTLADHTFITFRNGGDNWATDMLRDALLPAIADGHLRIDAQGYRPILVFINGSYWGIHELRQKYDTGWFRAKHHLESTEYDHLGYAHVGSSAITLDRIEGSTNRWIQLLSFLGTHDLNSGTNWAYVESQIDLDSFIDFIAVETYVINTSWRHNREFWCAHAPGSKWQWLTPDIDRGFDIANLGGSGELDALIAEDPVVKRLVKNPGFKARLAQRIAAHTASTFSAARLKRIVDRADRELTSEVPRHAARWGAQGGMTAKKRLNSLSSIETFATERPTSLFAELKKNLSLGGTLDLRVYVPVANGGDVLINGVPIEPGSVRLFANLPFELSARPAPGYRFDGWTGITHSPAPVQLTLNNDADITAQFVPSGGTILGNLIPDNRILTIGGSPYTWPSDLVVPGNVVLTVDPGVELEPPAGGNLRIFGSLQIRGTQSAPVRIHSREGSRWGGISFEKSVGTSVLSHVIIQSATRGINPAIYPAAISALDSHLQVDHLECLESDFPMFIRRGSILLTQSRLHNPYSGDCINVKGGVAEVSHSVFYGNNAPDTDAIDFDGVVNGVIRDNLIYRFTGSNSDGLDIGEKCVNLLVEENQIYFNADKGVSVGQGSSVHLRRNLIVGCTLGVGVKDAGSVLTADQNTFVDNQVGIAVYEKNFAGGGGEAHVSNSILSKCGQSTFTVDAFSKVEMTYCLSDTLPIPGRANLVGEIRFVSPVVLNFQILSGSPAVDAGDPGHVLDEDGSRADIGARYTYGASNYPYLLRDTVVVNEVLANSGNAGDWIELYNRTPDPIDISGWFLSDDSSDLKKYRIGSGTVIPGGGYRVFTELEQFGAASKDSGRITPFALSDTGESVYLSSANGDTLTGYRSKESFGPSLEGTSLGTYYKSVSDSFNFVTQMVPTPAAPNAGPKIGPIMITEIYYSADHNSDAEFIELLNISGASVPLYDLTKDSGWNMTDGVSFSFPTNVPVVMKPGERVVLARNKAALGKAFAIPVGTQVFEWTEGKLDNAGETVQIAQPGPQEESGVRHYVRVDRVSYESKLPWATDAALSGMSLTKLREGGYGNSYDNWTARIPSPGTVGTLETGGFSGWLLAAGLTGENALPTADPDGDGIPNLIEYATGSDPSVRNSTSPLVLTRMSGGGEIVLEFDIPIDRTDVIVTVESATHLGNGLWEVVPEALAVMASGVNRHRIPVPTLANPAAFFRLRVRVIP